MSSYIKICNEFKTAIETETMNETVGVSPKETEVETPKRTTKDILNLLREGKYLTNSGDYLVASTWGDTIRVTRNPLREDKYSSNSGDELTKEDLEEFSQISRLLEAQSKKGNVDYELECASIRLNRAGK